MGRGCDASLLAGGEVGIGGLVSWRACQGERMVLRARKREQNGLNTGGSVGCWQETLARAKSTIRGG